MLWIWLQLRSGTCPCSYSVHFSSWALTYSVETYYWCDALVSRFNYMTSFTYHASFEFVDCWFYVQVIRIERVAFYRYALSSLYSWIFCGWKIDSPFIFESFCWWESKANLILEGALILAMCTVFLVCLYWIDTASLWRIDSRTCLVLSNLGYMCTTSFFI